MAATAAALSPGLTSAMVRSGAIPAAEGMGLSAQQGLEKLAAR